MVWSKYDDALKFRRIIQMSDHTNTNNKNKFLRDMIDKLLYLLEHLLETETVFVYLFKVAASFRVLNWIK